VIGYRAGIDDIDISSIGKLFLFETSLIQLSGYGTSFGKIQFTTERIKSD
jgi:hypothetical protein